MLSRIVKRECLIVMRSAFRDVPSQHQRSTHQAMPDHEWNDLPLLLCERHELRRQLARLVSVERHIACCPGAIEDREQQQWVFGRFSERFSSLDELTRLFNGR